MANHSKKKGQRKNNKKKKTSPSSLTTSVDDGSKGFSYYDDTNGDNDNANATTGNNNSHNHKHTRTRNVNDDNMSWTDPSLLRFQVGTKVECNTSKGWSLGEIIQLNYKESDWDHYVPYQIRLIDSSNNDERRIIYAPMDCNYTIRKSTLLPQWQRRRKRPCQQQIFKIDMIYHHHHHYHRLTSSSSFRKF